MKFSNFKIILLILITILLILNFTYNVYAHEEDEEASSDLNQYLLSTSLNYILIASIIVIVSTLIAIFYKKKTEKVKWFLFILIVIPVILSTLYLTGSTIYLNLVSETRGPVHWHADFEIWNCGEAVDLIDPMGLLNRIGTSVSHEHGDNRIHVEGIVVEKRHVDLHSFFEVVGGSLTNNYFAIPTNKGIIEMRNGDLCNGLVGKLQAFVYKTENNIVNQEKLEDFEEYILSPYSTIPPGDCIILEFSQDKEKTEHICNSYKIAIEKGDIEYGS